MDPDITIILADTLLYIEGERNDVTQYPKLTLHSDILHTIWLSIILGIIPKSLALTQQLYFTHTGSKKNKIKMGQSTYHKNMENYLRTMDSPH